MRRWRYLLIGTTTEDEANALAERVRRPKRPAGAQVQVEPGMGMVWELMPRNPFAVFGGLGS